MFYIKSRPTVPQVQKSKMVEYTLSHPKMTKHSLSNKGFIYEVRVPPFIEELARE